MEASNIYDGKWRSPPPQRIVKHPYSEVVGAMLGTDALLYVEEGDYATYRHIYLMPPLTEVRIPMMRPAGMSSSGQAQARGTSFCQWRHQIYVTIGGAVPLRNI